MLTPEAAHRSHQRGSASLALQKGPVPSEGLLRELNPGPLAPGARIMPLDQAARCLPCHHKTIQGQCSRCWPHKQHRGVIREPLLSWLSRRTCAKRRAAPGIEPGTSRTRSENHATRPSSQMSALPSQNNSRPMQSMLAPQAAQRSHQRASAFLAFQEDLCQAKGCSGN